MKSIIIAIFMISAAGSYSYAGQDKGQEKADSQSFKPDEEILRNWAIIHCQGQAYKHLGYSFDQVGNMAINLHQSFEDRPEVNELFRRCVERQLTQFIRDFNR